MIDFIGKRAKLQLKINGKDLFFYVNEIIKYDDSHITFSDKYNKTYVFKSKDIVQLKLL